MFLLAEPLNCPSDYLIVSDVAVLRNFCVRGNGRRNSNQAIVIGSHDAAANGLVQRIAFTMKFSGGTTRKQRGQVDSLAVFL